MADIAIKFFLLLSCVVAKFGDYLIAENSRGRIATAIIVFFRPKLIGWPKRRLLNGPPLPPCGVHFWGVIKPLKRRGTKAYFGGLKHAHTVSRLLVHPVLKSEFFLYE